MNEQRFFFYCLMHCLFCGFDFSGLHVRYVTCTISMSLSVGDKLVGFTLLIERVFAEKQRSEKGAVIM